MRLKIAELLLRRCQASYIQTEGNAFRRTEIILCIFGYILLERPQKPFVTLHRLCGKLLDTHTALLNT